MSSISNARWILLSQATRTVIQLSSLVVLSRLLSPAEYGLMAMSTVVINFAYLLRDMGTAAAVIQRETLTDDVTSTVFWLNVGTGFVLGLSLVLLAPVISAVFKTPALTPFKELHGKRGKMITAVDLLRGLAALIGWERIEVPGATGYLDTDYAAKGRAAIDALAAALPRMMETR